ncbi:hypothetical protein GPECTOR_491g441 [Gonium pectorale]|uniref:Uncharacterized protein n=1 Tax=Gonium pectorale TaxID=33097 RepID=A0A150FWI7_GONPE|nr:hypothetical protein GPECTOR_491g441 [Gonium pectorale]|eukprot:KXZ41400.1 hypothetical protein GPECTOR_491g441 [Gonium pectorale]
MVFVMMPGSVEDERRFSVMSFLTNKWRNALEKNLRLCTRMLSQRFFTQRDFPYSEALQYFKEGAVQRGRYRK